MTLNRGSAVATFGRGDCLQDFNTVSPHFFQPEGLRLRIIGRLKTLTKLGGVVVSDEETAAALRMAAGSRISQVSLLMHSRTDTEPLRTLSLQTHAHTLTQYSNRKPDRAVDLDNDWYLKVWSCFEFHLISNVMDN